MNSTIADISIVLITTDRSPKKNYFSETAENLVRGGVFESERLNLFHVISGNAEDEHFDYHSIISRKGKCQIYKPLLFYLVRVPGARSILDR